jgi:hypothetical protein
VGYGGAEKLRQEIRECKRLTKKPFGVNVTKLPMLGSGDMFEDIAKVLIDEKVKVVETAGSQMPVEVIIRTNFSHALSASSISMSLLHCSRVVLLVLCSELHSNTAALYRHHMHTRARARTRSTHCTQKNGHTNNTPVVSLDKTRDLL